MNRTLSGVVSPLDAMESKLTTTFKRVGEQDLVTEFSGNGGVTFENTGPNTETALNTAKGVSPGSKDKGKVEIRACNEGACEHEEPVPW